ncbi:hypothetical protein [Streptomyces sp. NBC_00996]|uniref:hypothetical protein n=1 Tax=Streptomyces sp. NBC_00996 TaxID=2903710 RepID=UPI003868E6B4|nr:hypothetical protein OG390_21080 [Streptomyces sp. NBC_00996]
MGTEDARYQEDLKTSALIAIACQQELIRRAEEKMQKEREKLADLVYAATTKAPDNPIPYGRVEHVARLLGVKRDRVAKIRAAVRKNRAKQAGPHLETDCSAPVSLPAAA